VYTREQILVAVANCLDASEQQVIISRFGIEDGITRSLNEIEMRFGVTRAQVREIEKKVLNYIKEHIC